MIPEGRYTAHAMPDGHGLTETSKGQPQYRVDWQIEEGEHAGHVVTWFGGLGDKGLEYTMKALRAAGWEGDDITTVDLPASVRIKIVHEEWEGQTRAKVKYIDALNAGPAALPDDKRMTFAADVNARIKAWDAVNGGLKPSNGAKKQAPRKPDDDDIGF